MLLEHFAFAVPEPLFGPFDAEGAWRDFAASLVQTTFVATIALSLLALARRPRLGQRLQWALIATTVVELGVAQAPLVALAPTELWDQRPAVLEQLPTDRDDFRVLRDIEALPPSWMTRTSPDRQMEGLTWDRETLLPKYPLKYGISMTDVSGTMESEDYRTLLETVRGRTLDIVRGRHWYSHRSVLDLLGARFVVSDRPADGAVPLGKFAEDVGLYRRASARPRAWIVHQMQAWPELVSRKPSAIRMRTHSIRWHDSEPIDWADTAVVESNAAPPLMEPPQDASAERCRIEIAEPTCVEIDVQMASRGLVVLSDLYYPGWKAEVVERGILRELPIFRTNRVMRGVSLDAGEHRLVFTYRPASVAWGAAISAGAALALLVAALIRYSRSRRARMRLPA